jgi:hypothetical protein
MARIYHRGYAVSTEGLPQTHIGWVHHRLFCSRLQRLDFDRCESQKATGFPATAAKALANGQAPIPHPYLFVKQSVNRFINLHFFYSEARKLHPSNHCESLFRSVALRAKYLDVRVFELV